MGEKRGHCLAPSPLLEAPLLPAPEAFPGGSDVRSWRNW
jgi:hypothetical protein